MCKCRSWRFISCCLYQSTHTLRQDKQTGWSVDACHCVYFLTSLVLLSERRGGERGGDCYRRRLACHDEHHVHEIITDSGSHESFEVDSDSRVWARPASLWTRESQFTTLRKHSIWMKANLSNPLYPYTKVVWENCFNNTARKQCKCFYVIY